MKCETSDGGELRSKDNDSEELSTCVSCYYESYATNVAFKQSPAPDGHRCGVCPTYVQKLCAFDQGTHATYIFDNHCVMDLMNCMEGTDFSPLNYEHCLYFGNFAYVHGFKYEDKDYDESHIVVKGSVKNPDFV